MAQRKAHIIEDRERTEDIHVEENVDFESMYLSEHVLAGLKASGFERPSPIQLAAIPLGRCGLDMVVQAKSGTGKTCVFAVVALEMVSVSASTTQVLVLTPTREIAVQVTQVINAIGSKMPGLKASSFIGGMHLNLDKLKLKCCHVAVGTPGRITQLVELGLLRLENIRLFVLDEADQMLTGQFADSIAVISSGLPLNKQVLALSATYTEEVAKVAETLMRSPNHVRLDRESPALIGINQFVKMLPYHSQLCHRQQAKFVELTNILSTVTFNQCLVFSNSQLRAETICNKLRAARWPVSFLSGGQAQQDRLLALDALCSYKCRVLVSTDLSARGLDSEHVDLVINLDVPRDHATYLHRIGRAGRFGSKGTAVTLATDGDEWLAVRAIASLANLRIILFKDDLAAEINNQDENKEFVEYFMDDDLSQYLINNHKYGNSDGRNPKSVKGKDVQLENKKQSKSLGKHVGDRCVDKYLQENSHSIRENKRLSHKDKKIEREESNSEVEMKALENMQNLLKKSNVEQFSSSVSFDDIMKEVSEKYNSISADDNPTVDMPGMPGTLEISLDEEKDLTMLLKAVEEELQETILRADESWKDFMFNVENALQARTEGKENHVFLERVTKKSEVEGSAYAQQKIVNGKAQVTSGSYSSYSSFESLSKSRSKEVANGLLSDDVSVKCADRKYFSSKHKTSLKSKTKRERVHKIEDRAFENEYDLSFSERSSMVYPEYEYGEKAQSNKWHAYDNSGYLDDWYAYRPDNDYHNKSHLKDWSNGYEGYVRQNLLLQQKYVERMQNFSAMMDYVQTMGRMSYWIAMDYHSGV